MSPRARRDPSRERTASGFWALIACLVLVAPVHAAETVTGVEFTGNKTVEADTLRAQLKLGKGDPYDPAKIDQSIKALFATGLFAQVRIERRGGTLVVKVVENPIVERVFIEGSTITDKAKLDEQIQLKPKARYTASKAHADAVRLREHYRRLGRLTTSVEPSVVYQSDPAAPARRSRR